MAILVSAQLAHSIAGFSYLSRLSYQQLNAHFCYYSAPPLGSLV